LRLIDYVKEHYAGVYDEYLHDVEKFTNDIESAFTKIVKYGRTLCHGDFAHVNRIKTKSGGLKIYDWETSCYINPEYDAIAYLVRSAHILNDEYIASVLGEYFKRSTVRRKLDDYQECLMINLHMQFFYGYAWILPMFVGVESKEAGSFKLWFEMDNFMRLYNFLKCKKFNELSMI